MNTLPPIALPRSTPLASRWVVDASNAPWPSARRGEMHPSAALRCGDCGAKPEVPAARATGDAAPSRSDLERAADVPAGTIPTPVVRPPICCGPVTPLLVGAGIEEVRVRHPELERPLLAHVIYDLHVPSSAAQRLVQALDAEHGPQVTVLRCARCERPQFAVFQY